MLINLSSEDLIMESLLKILDADLENLIYILKKYSEEGSEYVNSLITNNIQDTVKNSYIKVFHVTSILNNDEASIYNQGIVNLKENLANDSELQKFFADYDIYFDIDSGYIQFMDYKINYLHKLLSDDWFFVRHRLVNDYNINAFFFIKNQKIDYVGIVRSSEFLSTLNAAINKQFSINLNLVNKWSIKSKSFIVEADVPIIKLSDGKKDNNPLPAEKLVTYMLDRLNDPHDIADGGDTAYFGFEEKINPSEIKCITQVEWQ